MYQGVGELSKDDNRPLWLARIEFRVAFDLGVQMTHMQSDFDGSKWRIVQAKCQVAILHLDPSEPGSTAELVFLWCRIPLVKIVTVIDVDATLANTFPHLDISSCVDSQRFGQYTA